MGTDPKIDYMADLHSVGNKSWSSKNMTQFTVFLTGLLLAITAFAILNILIKQMVEDDRRLTASEASQSIVRSLRRLESDINAATAVISMAFRSDDKTLRENVLAVMGHEKDFEHLIWLKPGKGGDWQSVIINDQDSLGLSPVQVKSVVHLVQARVGTRQENTGSNVMVITDIPGLQEQQEYTDPIVKERFVALASIVGSEGDQKGIVIGVMHLSHFIDEEWLDNRPSVLKVELHDNNSKKRIYYMSRNDLLDKEADTSKTQETFSAALGDVNWQIDIAAMEGGQTRFLENMPWLMLLFGVALTLIGTLYVRNNQRQAYMLGKMNRQLAQKNYELNTQMAERERLNNVLRKAERESKAIIDSVNDVIFETLRDGEITFVNDTWQSVTGFTEEQTLGRNLFDFIYPQDQEEQRLNYDMLIKGKKPAYRVFTKIRTSDGVFRSVEMGVSMLRQDENKNTRIVGTFTDIEERQRAEKALGEAEKKYRTIVENAAGGIYQVTPEGQFLSANPAMARILGYDTPEEMLSKIKNAHDFLYTNTKDRAAFIRDIEARGYVQGFETQVKTRDGARIWVNENAHSVKDNDGNTLYYEGSMENVTSRKEAEISLKEAKVHSDLANRAKSEFLANMSHELRTPLNAIIGFSEIIHGEVLGPIENRQYWEYAKDIHVSGQKLLTIINDILDVSRIEAGDRPLNETVVNMNDMLASCIDFISERAKLRKLKISDITKNELPNIIGEERAIKQIMVNLLGNAIKYTPEGGRVTVSHEMENDGRLRVSVTDTGIGMDEDDIEKALSPFGQVETTLDRAGSGTGLGLTLAQALIKLHDGVLEIFSQKGIGTTATIIFPAKRVAKDRKEDAGVTKSDPSQSGQDQNTHTDEDPSGRQIH